MEKVGDGVDGLASGDFVVLAWRAPCGSCRSCRRGRPWYCFASRNAAQPMTLDDGTVSRLVTSGRERLVDRSIHRGQHLDTIERAFPGR